MDGFAIALSVVGFIFLRNTRFFYCICGGLFCMGMECSIIYY